jgi:Phage capsid protein
MPGAAPQIQYRDEFIAAFGQRQSLLKDVTVRETMIKGNQATFLIADSSGTAVTRGVNGLIPTGDNSNTQVVATLVEKHDLREMTDFNIFQSQGDQRAIMQMNTMSVINRDIDSVILTELATGTLDTGAAATASLTMISKAMSQLMINGVQWDGQVYAVISPAFLMYLMAIASFSSADYVTVKPFVNFPGWSAGSEKSSGQGWYEWMNVKWIVSNQIAGIGTASETCFMFHRSAIGHAVNTGMVDSEIGYEGKQKISWARASLYHGAKLLQNTGVVRMIHDGSAFVAT